MKPEELKYTKNHCWLFINNDQAKVGISDYAQNELGDIVFVEMPEIGKNIKKDDNIGTIESVKSVSDMISPLTGEIIEINKVLEDTPETINKDPYEKGWIFSIRIKNKDEIDDLMDYDAYNKFIESEK